MEEALPYHISDDMWVKLVSDPPPKKTTLPNIAPENDGFQWQSLFPGVYVQGIC